MFLKKLLIRKAKYTRLVDISIDSQAIRHNLDEFRSKYGLAVAPVLKSNAYGHGLLEVASIVSKEDVPFVCVDTFFEASVLRNADIKKPILIIGYTPLENIQRNDLQDVSFAVISLEELRLLTKEKVKAKIHLKIDTGMHRHGLLLKELDEAIKILKENKNLELEGVYTHLSDADSGGSIKVLSQIDVWNEVNKKIKLEVPGVKYFHCAQTAGSFYSGKIEANVIRLGIGLYGINVGLDELDLKPALTMRTRISSVRKLSPGELIGYNGTYRTEKEMLVASIPVGYNEGLDRRLSNKGKVLVAGVPCDVLGRVSMNITSIDVSSLPGVKLNAEVLVISNDPSEPNSIEAMAKTCGTIPYELLVHIPESLRRNVI